MISKYKNFHTKEIFNNPYPSIVMMYSLEGYGFCNDTEKYIQEMLDLSSKGSILPFITIHKSSHYMEGTTPDRLVAFRGSSFLYYFY